MKKIFLAFAVVIALAAMPIAAINVATFTATPAVSQTSAPVTQNTVTTSGPVSSETTISMGTIAGHILAYVVAAFGTILGSVATVWIVRLAKKAGVEVTQQMSDQLDKTLVNGLNDAATKVTAATQGMGTVAVKNQIVAGAIQYAQEHRAETIQALGLDPQSGAAVAALRARIATLAADPTVPTPAVLTPVTAPAKA